MAEKAIKPRFNFMHVSKIAFINAFSRDEWKLQAVSSNCRKSPDALLRFYIKKGWETERQHVSEKPVKARTHDTLFINVMVQLKCKSCQVGRRKQGPSFYPGRLYSPCLTFFFFPLSPFQVGSSGSSQTAGYLSPYTSRYQCPSSLRLPPPLSKSLQALQWFTGNLLH